MTYDPEVIEAAARVGATFADGCDRCEMDDLIKLEDAGLMDRKTCEDDFGQDSLEVGETMWVFNATGSALVDAIRKPS
jgi:hypothetical protein